MRVMCCSTSSTSLQRAFKCPFHFYFNGRRFTYRRQINLRNLITAHQKSLKWMQKGESSALEFGTSQNDCILIVKCEIYWMFWALLLQSKLRSIYVPTCCQPWIAANASRWRSRFWISKQCACCRCRDQRETEVRERSSPGSWREVQSLVLGSLVSGMPLRTW